MQSSHKQLTKAILSIQNFVNLAQGKGEAYLTCAARDLSYSLARTYIGKYSSFFVKLLIPYLARFLQMLRYIFFVTPNLAVLANMHNHRVHKERSISYYLSEKNGEVRKKTG